MAIITGVVSSKGGGTKTTTALNLGGVLADCNQRTLLIDADPQGSLTKSVQYRERSEHGLTRMMLSGSPAGCIGQTTIQNLDIVENDDGDETNSHITPFLRESSANILSLSDALEALQDQYDYIIIDTQGVKGTQLHEAVILASDRILTPIVPNALDAAEFDSGALKTMNRLIPRGHRKLTIAGKAFPQWHALISRAKNTNSNREIREYIRQTLRKSVVDVTGGGIHFDVLTTAIPDKQPYIECTKICEPVHRLEKSTRSKTPPALTVMTDLMSELFPELAGLTPQEDY